jgi:NAD-dependent dihydropyrimidine dehydrogenase PreA subunit
MKRKRKIIEIDEERCDGCGQCVPACAEGSLEIVEGKARVIEDRLCDGLGACLGECPNDALRIVEREAEEFDEEAVEKHLAGRQELQRKPPEQILGGGCPSAGIRQFSPRPDGAKPAASAQAAGQAPALGHWPVQIRLIPPTAPFLKGADLLVLADCVPVAFPTLHRDFLHGKAVAMGCPKLDDAEAYIEKFTQIFREADIRSITTVIMEVPCCSGLPTIVRKALAASQSAIPMEEVVISTRGEILERRR